MYVKIPHLKGENNINLTIGYVQEEEPTHKFEEKEEDNKQFSTSFEFIIKFLVTNFYEQRSILN